MCYTNIFTAGQPDAHEPAVFDCDKVIARTECGQGVLLQWHRLAYHYVVRGRLVTMRCGASKELLERITGHITRGAEPYNPDLLRCAHFYDLHNTHPQIADFDRERVAP